MRSTKVLFQQVNKGIFIHQHTRDCNGFIVTQFQASAMLVFYSHLIASVTGEKKIIFDSALDCTIEVFNFLLCLRRKTRIKMYVCEMSLGHEEQITKINSISKSGQDRYLHYIYIHIYSSILYNHSMKTSTQCLQIAK